MASSFKMSSDDAKDRLRSSFEFSSDEVKDSLMSSFKVSSDEVKDSLRSSFNFSEFCDPCTIGEGIEKTALFFCQECQEFLCDDCRDFHKKVSVTNKHNVSRINGPKTASDRSGQVDDLPEQFSNITVNGATAETRTDSTAGARKPFRKAKLTNQINTSLDDDQQPSEIRGIAVVDNLIYVADKANGKIKLFSETGKAIAQYSETNTFDITAIGKDKIAFTSLGSHFTIIIKTGEMLKLVETVDTGDTAKGICCYNNLIYVSLYSVKSPNKSQIKIFTTDGEPRRRMEPILGGSTVLLKPGYLCISHRTGMIYVSDFDLGVIALSSMGKVQFIKQVFDTTQTAQGISIDDQGQVYICGLSTGNVMTMSADGSDKYEILSKGCASAQVVKIVGNKMYFCCRNTDLVCVFNLKNLKYRSQIVHRVYQSYKDRILRFSNTFQ